MSSKGKENRLLRPLAELVVDTLAPTLGEIPRSTDCLSRDVLEKRAGDQAIDADGGWMLAHAVSCARCRRIMMSLACMEVERGQHTLWRLKHIKLLVAEGSAKANAVADRSRSWLQSLHSKACPVPVAASLTMFESPAQNLGVDLVCYPFIDDASRLVIQVRVDLPVGTTCDTTVSLTDEHHALELFNTRISLPYVEAIVDLSGYVGGSVDIRGASVKLTLAEVTSDAVSEAELTRNIESVLRRSPLNIDAIDRLLEIAANDPAALTRLCSATMSSATSDRAVIAVTDCVELLGRYVAMWVTGNAGGIPPTVAELYTVLFCALNDRPATLDDFQTSYAGPLPAAILQHHNRPGGTLS